jgi:hypothetical protein
LFRNPSIQVGPGAFQAADPDLLYHAYSSEGVPRPFPALSETTWDATRGPRGFDCEAGNGNIYTFRPLFGNRGPLRAFTPDGLLARAEETAYRIDLVEAERGTNVRTLERDYPPLPVTDDAWQRATRSFREVERRVGSLGCDIEGMRPEFFPVLRTLISDDSGRLWVEATAPEGIAWAIIDPSGGLLGEAPMIERDGRVIPYARGNFLYLVAVDENEQQAVHVFEARPGPPG